LPEKFRSVGPVMCLLLRYTHALMTQVSRTAACHRHHSVEQQLCRWLLLTLNRLPSNDLRMTQELIANMLGVRREGVTEAAGKLQKQGFIQCRRGHISVLNRVAREGAMCEGNAVVKKECARLLSDVRLNQDRLAEKKVDRASKHHLMIRSPDSSVRRSGDLAAAVTACGWRSSIKNSELIQVKNETNRFCSTTRFGLFEGGRFAKGDFQ
jgi:hypothetical protein